MQVVKRNLLKTEYDKNRIINAVLKAMNEGEGEDLKTANEIEQEIYNELILKNTNVPVDEISEMTEDKLLRKGFINAGRRYISYRKEREYERNLDDKKYVLLSKEFLSKYKHLPSPMTQLGDLVYYRTYSRFLDKLGRREYWWETVRRAVEYNCSLIKTTKEEAEELFDNIFHLRQFLSAEHSG